MITEVNVTLTENQLNTLLDVLDEEDWFETGKKLKKNQLNDVIQIYDKLIDLQNVFKRNKDIENNIKG